MDDENSQPIIPWVGTPWSEETLKERMRARTRELGITMAQLPGQITRPWGPKGPSLRTLMDTASQLRWTMPELLGVTASAGPYSDQLLATAIKTTAEAISPLCQLTSEQKDLLAEMFMRAVGMIAEMAARDQALAFSEGALLAISLQLEALLPRSDSENS